MKNWKLPPEHPDVARYVEFYWYLESSANNPDHASPKLNPDTSGHLILADTGQRFHYEHKTHLAKGQGSHWLFPHCQTFTMDHSQPFRILGIKFHTGALYSLVPQSPKSLLDQVTEVSVNTLLTSGAETVPELLDLADSKPQTCCDSMDEQLLPWLSQNQPDTHSRLVQSTLPLLSNTPVSGIGQFLHCSQRTLERSFTRVTGLTLKQCQSILRLEALLEHLYQREGQEINWAMIAQQFKFSDQPHLIRYLKKNLGTTPGEYIKHRDFTINIYGDFNTP